MEQRIGRVLARGIATGIYFFIFASASAYADSAANTSTAIGASAETAAILTESGVKATSGAVALPLGVAGSTATAVGSTAAAIAEDSAYVAGQPLSVDDEVVIAADGPPRVPREPFQDNVPAK